jgi:1-phosphatidylinositol phosphodiesterase
LALPSNVAKGIVGVEGVNSVFGKTLLGQIGGIVPLNTTAAPGAKKEPILNEKNSAQRKGVGSSSKTVGPQTDNGQGTSQEPRIRGWAFLDYYAEPSGIEVVPLLVECNFLGRKTGEEGW